MVNNNSTLSNPRISILIAARNEEININSCLKAVLTQAFPSEQYEVWVGDDNSTDQTADIIKELQQLHSNLYLLPIDKNSSGLVGKANVLSQLAAVAGGEILLITDADVVVPYTWVKSYSTQFNDATHMISAVVALTGTSIFAKLQNADWLNYMAKCNISSNNGQPVTAVGCNMGIRASTYRAIGGYERIPFSITEDYELFRAVMSAGYSFKNLLDQDVLAFTNPVESFQELLKQRRRWLTGSFRQNWRYILAFNLNCLLLPSLILLAFMVNPLIPFGILIIKWARKILFLRGVFNKLKIKLNIGIVLFTPYEMLCNVVFMFFQFIPSPVEWKGRKYA